MKVMKHIVRKITTTPFTSTRGVKVQCDDIDLKAELYGNRADAHLRLGEAIFVL